MIGCEEWTLWTGIGEGYAEKVSSGRKWDGENEELRLGVISGSEVSLSKCNVAG